MMLKKMYWLTIKLSIALALCAAFLFYVPLRTKVTANYAAPALKDLSQVKSEAASYNKAMTAIRSIASLKLDDPTQMKQALSIIDREASALQFSRSKLIVLGLADSTFTAAVKKAAPDQKSAEALVKQLTSDPKSILKLDGAQTLLTKLQQSAQTDSSSLKSIASRLTTAAANFKKTADIRSPHPQSGLGEFKIIAADYKVESAASVAPEPQAETALYIGLIIAFYVMVGIGVMQAVDFKEQQDPVADCQAGVDRDRNVCVAAARRQPFPINIGAEALCDATWLEKSAACLLL